MRKLVRVKEGEAVLHFTKRGTELIHSCTEELLPAEIANAALLAYACQHPVFERIVVEFLREVGIVTQKVVH